MDPDQRSPRTRKYKFSPKSPPTRKHKPQTLKTEPDEDIAQLRRYENLKRREPKIEKTSSVEVAFGPAGGSSSSLRTYGTSKAVDSGTNSGSPSKHVATEQIRSRHFSTANEDQDDTWMIDDADDTTNTPARKISEYKEPWDYDHSHYPTTLPLRKPNSGDSEILDEQEFGEAAASVEYDENAVNSAAELGLLEKSEQQKIIFFKFPTTLPLDKQSNKGKEKISASTASGESTKSKGSVLEELSGGYMGKMLVYKSGKIKLKLGETLFDVSHGSNCVFAQAVVAMNTAEKQCCDLGELSKRAVVVPDLDSIEL